MTRPSEPKGLAEVVDRALTGPALMVGLLIVLTLARVVFTLAYVNSQTENLGVAQSAIVNGYTGMLDEETGLRGFMATGDRKYLDPYTRGLQEVDTGTSALRAVAHGLGLDQKAQRLAAAEAAWQQQWARHAALGAADSNAFLTTGKELFDTYRAVEADAAAAVSDQQARIGRQFSASLYVSLAASSLVAGAFAVRWVRGRRLLVASVVVPIESLLADLERMSSGDLSPTAEPQGPREISQMASALRRTAESLATARQGRIDEQRRLDQILGSLPVGVFVVDGKGMAVYANEKAIQLLGRDIDTEASIDTYSAVYGVYVAGTDDSYPAGDHPIARALAGEAAEVDNIEVRGPDRTILLGVRATALRDPEGEIVGALAAMIDVTEIRAARESMRNRSLDLERSNADLEQFAYVASHDLQEPLRMVTSYVQLIEHRYGDLLDDDGREFIGYVVDGADRMQSLISGLLAYSRVGRQGAPMTGVDVTTVVADAIANLAAAVADTGAEISVGPMPGEVTGDPVQLTQLFQNLIGNALKFCRDRTPRITVVAENRPWLWEFRISDNGIGIDPAHRQRVFQMFQRLHARSEYPGTGIGLAICHRIVERHGGTMWIDAAEGGGTSFFFTLPSDTMARYDRSRSKPGTMEGDDVPADRPHGGHPPD